MKTKSSSALVAALALTLQLAAADTTNVLQTPIAPGPFQPTWKSLQDQYQTPEWFRDAKFGIWAHWGAQCQPAAGDWYARHLYVPEKKDYKFHVEHYGHPSKAGFKEVIHEWKAENFDPDALLAFYKKSGAKYFLALANHHDNFDNYDSKHQPWNSVALGPKKDLIGLWAAAAKKNGLRFGVSVHASRAWSWYETAQGADTNGPLAGVPYDGKLTQADGKGLWWDGLDPQALYAQNHAVGAPLVWNPGNASNAIATAYLEKYYLRTKQLWDDYQPDQIYFDDSGLPMRGITDELGLKLAAHFYNSSIQRHGQNEAVINGKLLLPEMRKALVYDIERGKAEGILPQPWQTDTCIGQWHYDANVFKHHYYKTAATIIPMLADIVSKNGNLMLSVPLKGDGTLDDDEVKVVSGIGDWLRVNGEAIYATRPWKIYGEGPSTQISEKGHFDGQSDTQKQAFTAGDFRFTQSKDGQTLYAIALALPKDGKLLVRSLAADQGEVQNVTLLGDVEKLAWKQTPAGLEVTLPASLPCAHALALKIQGASLTRK